MRAFVARDLADATVAGLSADRRFATAYNAGLLAANMAIACVGYRVTAKTGHHKISFDSIKFALGSERRLTLVVTPRILTGGACHFVIVADMSDAAKCSVQTKRSERVDNRR